MCTPWNADQWQEKSRPVATNSRYEHKDTRYNQAGEVARTYVEDDGYWYAVLPTHSSSFDIIEEGWNDVEPHGAALAYLAENGYTLTEPLAQEGKPTTIADVAPRQTPAIVSGFQDLVLTLA